MTKWTQIKKSDNISVCEHVQEKEHPGITGGSTNWDSFLKGNMMAFINSNYVYIPKPNSLTPEYVFWQTSPWF